MISQTESSQRLIDRGEDGISDLSGLGPIPPPPCVAQRRVRSHVLCRQPHDLGREVIRQWGAPYSGSLPQIIEVQMLQPIPPDPQPSDADLEPILSAMMVGRAPGCKRTIARLQAF